ncbi:GNAT family N-acetyltransferase [Gordonibacter massiliensis (ex Traore et al. 2017)]|uniref:GNAT family N-acetyltransferase n=1 Tax=Gordonibacter massiliensis (ex Traore et al. 2017) TaxID=1841863 RepID=A0A842J9B7_9ACTN|nr:GNAT family N-acetyltransferase [Gordonibacter massiliensis (ex Traore et al. 2017)]MBC2888672.1 GNAT family N-acetyltransferase [Gordonibacter massiliensis (ex Traore et al. 2017)]
MQLPGLVTVPHDQAALLDELAAMVGTCFLEEMWYATWLEALDDLGADRSRKLAITQAVIRADYEVTSPYGCVYTLDDRAGAANVYLRSELGGASWPALEEQSARRLESVLTADEQEVLVPRAEAMEPLSDTNWPLALAGDDDYLYFISAGVDPARRGSGAFGRLFKPFLVHADERGLRCYLDCYTDRLEGIYGHYGFETVERKTAPGFDLVERCMVRSPR